MTQVNMLEAKTNLSRLVKMLEDEQESVIYVARDGKPVVQMTLVDSPALQKRIGIAEGEFVCPEEFDAWDDEVRQMFGADV